MPYNYPAEMLIVEDNPDDAELILRAFNKHNLSDRLYLAENGEDALDFIFCTGKFSERNPDIPLRVVFLDLKLPGLDGMEVLRRIKDNPKTRKLPVVIISSSREAPDIKSAYDLGANSYVVKPVDFSNFMEAISASGYYWMFLNESP